MDKDIYLLRDLTTSPMSSEEDVFDTMRRCDVTWDSQKYITEERRFIFRVEYGTIRRERNENKNK